jgi:hypothetical protein
MKTTKRTKTSHYESAPTIKIPVPLPKPEAIRLRAHQIFLERGGAPERELDDWLMAEHELKQEHSRK